MQVIVCEVEYLQVKNGNSLMENRDVMVNNLKAVAGFEDEMDQPRHQDTNSSSKYFL